MIVLHIVCASISRVVIEHVPVPRHLPILLLSPITTHPLNNPIYLIPIIFLSIIQILFRILHYIIVAIMFEYVDEIELILLVLLVDQGAVVWLGFKVFTLV